MTNRSVSRFDRLSELEKRVALELVSRLRQQFDGQLASAILFGSRARGDAQPDSDMDVVVVLSTADWKLGKRIHYLAADVGLEYGIYPSTHVYSLAEWRRLEELRTGFYRNVQREGIDLLRLALTPG